MRTAAILAVALSVAGCAPPPPPDAQHFVCADKFTGEPVFAFWDDTATDATLVIGGSSYATVRLDDGRQVKVTNADVADNYQCRVDATRPAPRD